MSLILPSKNARYGLPPSFIIIGSFPLPPPNIINESFSCKSFAILYKKSNVNPLICFNWYLEAKTTLLKSFFFGIYFPVHLTILSPFIFDLLYAFSFSSINSPFGFIICSEILTLKTGFNS